MSREVLGIQDNFFLAKVISCINNLSANSCGNTPPLSFIIFSSGAFHNYYKAYESHRFTYSTLLSSSVKKDLFHSRSRNYSGYRAKAMFAENIAEGVYDNLIESVHQNLKPG